jgi:sec-independent protein translocase protein TatB
MDISSWEILVILVVALIVLGPERLAEVAHMLGRCKRGLRHLTDKARAELELQEKHWQLQKNIEKAKAAENSQLSTSESTPQSHV